MKTLQVLVPTFCIPLLLHPVVELWDQSLNLLLAVDWIFSVYLGGWPVFISILWFWRFSTDWCQPGEWVAMCSHLRIIVKVSYACKGQEKTFFHPRYWRCLTEGFSVESWTNCEHDVRLAACLHYMEVNWSRDCNRVFPVPSSQSHSVYDAKIVWV